MVKQFSVDTKERGLYEITARVAAEVSIGEGLCAEGPDDMPGHIKAALTATSLSIPIQDGRLALGQWQGIYLWEHRRRGSRREIVLHVGE